MRLNPVLRKLVLSLHITVSVGWIGALIAYLVLVIAAMLKPDESTLPATWLMLDLIATYAIVPLALAAFLLGILISLGTAWGLFRHYWVLISLLLSLFAVIILLEHLQTVHYFANLAAAIQSANLGNLQAALKGELVHGGLGLLILLVVQVLNVYKPRGLTPYGWRKQEAQRIAFVP